MWDAAGVSATRSAHEGAWASGQPQRRSTARRWADEPGMRPMGGECFQPPTGQLEPVAAVPGHARVADFRRVERGGPRRNSGASLVDLGDGIGCIELHSLKNAIGGDVVSLISSVLKPGLRRGARLCRLRDHRRPRQLQRGRQPAATAAGGAGGRVGRSRTRRFARFQQMTAAIKFCPRPVVVAPFGMTLGGGAEICLHARAPPASRRNLHRSGRGRRRPDSRRRRNQGNAAARCGCGRRAGAARPQGSAFALCAVGGDAGRRCGARSKPLPWPRSPRRPLRRAPLGLACPVRPHHLNRERLLLDAKAAGGGAGRGRLRRSAAAHADSRAGPGRAGGARDRHLPDGRSRLRLRARPEGGALGGLHPGRRPRDGRVHW